jgi:hypothetical protein
MQFVFLCLFFLFNYSIASIDTNTDDIAWPLELKLPISGTFAEFRNSHMHMGCDYKTYRMNGFKVLSVFDGHISSISYSPIGYGLSLNVYSPKLQMTAKYGHLNDLQSEVNGLEQFKIALLLLNGTGGFNLKLKPEHFKVKVNQGIANSGETGSGVSHLHLELFNQTEYFNPLSFKNFIQKDTTPPELLALFVDTDQGFAKKFKLNKIEKDSYELEQNSIKLSGKVKFKIAGYDRITSKNPNNIYSIELNMNGKKYLHKSFDRMTIQNSHDKEAIYDSNLSSLNPPFYVYNLFSKSDSYSIDLSQYTVGTAIKVEVVLGDSSGNKSKLNFTVEVGSQEKTLKTKLETIFESSDKKLKLDFSSAKIHGEGKIQIQKLNSIPEQIKVPQLDILSEVYEVTAVDYSWKGTVAGNFEFSSKNKNESIYLFDSVLNTWFPIHSTKNSNSFKFNFTRLGYIAILKDTFPPIIYYPQLLHRYYNLPEIMEPNMIERFYAISDRGSGISSQFEVYLDGEIYPYHFERDRNFLKLEIPSSLKSNKGFVFLQIRAHDFAGNYSEWFTDILQLK